MAFMLSIFFLGNVNSVSATEATNLNAHTNHVVEEQLETEHSHGDDGQLEEENNHTGDEKKCQDAKCKENPNKDNCKKEQSEKCDKHGVEKQEMNCKKDGHEDNPQEDLIIDDKSKRNIVINVVAPKTIKDLPVNREITLNLKNSAGKAATVTIAINILPGR